jgi:hypothetical protein
MSEYTYGNPEESVEQYITTRSAWLEEAVKIAGAPEGSSPVEVFAAPTSVRADAPAPGYTTEQEEAIREIAGRFGIGGEADVPAIADVEIIEGGKPWKVEAEALIANPQGVRIYAGSSKRRIGADEAAYVQNKLANSEDAAATIEYDMVRQIAEMQPGFIPLEKDVVWPFGYKVEPGHAVVREKTGQLRQIGTQDDQPVVLLRVDREDYVDEQGADKYRNQPDSLALMSIVDSVYNTQGYGNQSIGLLTSNTYASRAVDIVRAGLKSGSDFRVGMYGRQTIAEVQDKPTAEPTSINQIPGELHVIAKKLALLAEESQS